MSYSLAASLTRAAEPIEFSRDVLPILSANCFACHGPDEHERQADLRLDIEDVAKQVRDSGTAVVAGDVDKSSIIARLTSSDPELVMPPPKANRKVNPEQIETLRRWIAEGAKWQRHWSFEPVTRPAGTLDDLVSSALAKKGLVMQPPALPHQLVRRLSLDLIGLPPTLEMTEEFAQNPTLASYEQLVEDLLSRPQFGEHWGRMWLDFAHYADTKGYEKDLGRTMWPYRDWVVEALNADMPLDQFTVEQLAGDLLPNPTESQLVATAFHRNTMSNDEGGTDDEEFRSVAVKDRIDTTVQVWMGLTMGCAKCHSHKYDPISNTAYYRFYALFNQTEDADRHDDAPRLQIASESQREERATLASRVKELETSLKALESPTSETPKTPESPQARQLRDDLATAQKSLKEFDATLAMLPIMRELPAEKQRTTKLHKRGNFLDPGDVVTPDVLAEFGSLPEGTPHNRLGAALWLVSKENPLTPRVWANRIWARLFGMGLVETEEDFGALGSPPSNPALLDWLAAEYLDSGWSLKKLIKSIVMSATYRQASEITAELRETDPRNVLMSRGARYRLSAEVVRDQTLAVAGLLSLKQGGPSVMPPQPAGLWRSTYNGQNWIDAQGEDRYRRGLYTYLKRTTPYPSLTTFDAGSGEVCQVRRIRTNTPLQALVTLNDPVYLEAAAALAKRMVTEADATEARAALGLRLAIIRPLRFAEAEPLVKLQRDAQAAFEAAPEQAAELIKSSRGEAGAMQPTEFAAWIVTANAILNLDEFLTRN